MTSVAVHSAAPVARVMASPAIRSYNLALALAAHGLDVTLIAPGEIDLPLDGVESARAPRGTHDLERALGRFDVVVAQKLPLRTMRCGGTLAARVVYDLYTPALPEGLATVKTELPGTRAVLLARVEALAQRMALATGDGFVCPGERQRDFWIGMLGTLGRVELETYRRDRTLRDLIDVVPFGVPAERPRPGRPALKGVVPRIEASDTVILWLGGLVAWTDPLTVIRAVGDVAKRRDAVRLVFVGVSEAFELPMERRAVDLARSLGLLDRVVFFRPGWVPYDERQNYLLDADLGVAAYVDALESRLAFRARLLDYFWAGLPTITTAGEELGELVERRGLGRAVPPGDVGAWAGAIEELLDSETERAEIGRRLGDVRDELAWPRVVEPLVRLARLTSDSGRARVPSPSRLLEEAWLRGRLRLDAGRISAPRRRVRA